MKRDRSLLKVQCFSVHCYQNSVILILITTSTQATLDLEAIDLSVVGLQKFSILNVDFDKQIG